MHATLQVFTALQSFDRPCTRIELERETGLCKRAVENGLEGLLRRGLLYIDGQPRARSTYRLIPGAVTPEPRRGRYDRAARAGAAGAPVHFSAAAPPSHSAQSGALRTTISSLQTAHRGPTAATCALAHYWRKR